MIEYLTYNMYYSYILGFFGNCVKRYFQSYPQSFFSILEKPK